MSNKNLDDLSLEELFELFGAMTDRDAVEQAAENPGPKVLKPPPGVHAAKRPPGPKVEMEDAAEDPDAVWLYFEN